MTITKLHISSFRGANRRPGCGDVTFADGASYGWLRLPDDSISFSGWRKRQGSGEFFSFRSARREAALRAVLDL